MRADGWETGEETIKCRMEELERVWEIWGITLMSWHYEEKGKVILSHWVMAGSGIQKSRVRVGLFGRKENKFNFEHVEFKFLWDMSLEMSMKH